MSNIELSRYIYLFSENCIKKNWVYVLNKKKHQWDQKINLFFIWIEFTCWYLHALFFILTPSVDLFFLLYSLHFGMFFSFNILSFCFCLDFRMLIYLYWKKSLRNWERSFFSAVYRIFHPKKIYFERSFAPFKTELQWNSL